MGVFFFCVCGAFAQSVPAVEQWGRFEFALRGTPIGNPFNDVALEATFTNGGEEVTVNGFYDGGGVYRVRFMPEKKGTWSYATVSNMPALDGKTGTFECVNPGTENHGPVKTRGMFDFAYADGKPYYPFGTTVYAFVHQGDSLENTTLETLRNAPFNKVRICVFPKNYEFNDREPEYYPFKRVEGVELIGSNQTAVWDFTKFDPEFFQHLEKRIDRLNDLGIECDLILFHPYDNGRWGFDRMTRPNDIRYLEYVTARLASFRNIWWSMANEFDYMKEKTLADWQAFLETVAANDPYGHLRSVHNGDTLFNHHNPLVTHASVQSASMLSDFGRGSLMRDAYLKPVMFDEVCYEGNIESRWGNLSAREMTHRFWQGALVGAYVTHGETYLDPDDIIWWAAGGVLRGQSPARIGFLRRLIEQETGALHLIDNWRTLNASMGESGQIVIYFGKETPTEWAVTFPAKIRWADGTQFNVEVIDTWEMTRTPVPGTFTAQTIARYVIGEADGKKIKLPGKPYQALLITRVP
jgi:hypothetical protein